MKVQFCRVSEKTIHKYNHLLVKLVGRRLQTVVESERVTSKQTKSVDTEWRRPSENCRLLKYLTPATEVERANTTQTLGRPFDWSENIQKLFAPQTFPLFIRNTGISDINFNGEESLKYLTRNQLF